MVSTAAGDWWRRWLPALALLLLPAGCKAQGAGAAATNPPGLLAQDLDSLDGPNGRIVDSMPILVKSKWSEGAELHKIKYLSDGLQIVGFVVRPRKAGTQYPAILFNRGGNREFGRITDDLLGYFAYLCSRGYVVLASQYRGADGGQGRDEFGGEDVNDVLNLVKTSKSLPFVDPQKVVMLGFSRGGMMTYLAIKRGAGIKAAAVIGGATDIGQTYRERDEAMKRVIRDLVGMDEGEWRKRSASLWPEEIDVPVLLLHGEKDARVGVSQARKMAKGLAEAGKVYRLRVFPGAGHNLRGHHPEMNEEIFRWFERYL